MLTLMCVRACVRACGCVCVCVCVCAYVRPSAHMCVAYNGRLLCDLRLESTSSATARSLTASSATERSLTTNSATGH